VYIFTVMVARFLLLYDYSRKVRSTDCFHLRDCYWHGLALSLMAGGVRARALWLAARRVGGLWALLPCTAQVVHGGGAFALLARRAVGCGVRACALWAVGPSVSLCQLVITLSSHFTAYDCFTLISLGVRTMNFQAAMSLWTISVLHTESIYIPALLTISCISALMKVVCYRNVSSFFV